MAENILETRILLRYGTYSQWMNSDVILKLGEAAIAAFPNKRTIATSNDMPDYTPPAIGIKIGDGQHYFYELPWVQAVAADVYTWAKSSSKPQYNAGEIQGLYDFIQNNAPSGPGDGTVAPRIYQIVRGTDENINRYYLQYKESTESDTWVTDYNHYIDVDAFVKIVNWIGNDVDNFASLGNRTEDHIQYDLSRLTVSDSQQDNQIVSAVSQTNGKIEVTKRTLGINDISGTAEVERGGTGKTLLTEGEVLVGNGTNPIRQIPIDTEVGATNNLVANYAVKQYVDNAVSGIEGAMHFRGEATVEPTGNNDPRASDYNFSRAQPGDVVLWEYKEYVWTGSVWRLLGDEGSYAIKGSITDADIAADADINQSKILNLVSDLAEKVDKEEGKGLSSNDYTTEEKVKLENIEAGAQKNVIEHILMNGSEVLPIVVENVPNTVPLTVKEFDDNSREKLEGIEPEAQVNTIETISLNGESLTPDENRNVEITINEFTQEYEEKLNGIEDNAQENVIESISLNNTALIPDNNKNVEITINEFTEEDERKLGTIQEGAQVNSIETIYLNGTQVVPNNNKRIDLTINEITQEQIDKLESIETGAQVNLIEHIVIDGTEVIPNNNKVIAINTDPHTEHENVIESITINGTTYPPDNNKAVNITLDQAALNLNVLEGAQIPGSQGTQEEVTIVSKKLQLARIAATGNVADLLQTQDTYILFDCGSSTEVI